MKRIIFLNNKAVTFFYDLNIDLIFSFEQLMASIGTIVGLIYRAEASLCSGNLGDEFSAQKKFTQNVLAGAPFEIIVEDKSGYSRICPKEMEYEQIADLSLETLEDLDSFLEIYKLPKSDL